MDGAPFDAGNLPLGTSAITVLKFNFLAAIDELKESLPADYIRDSWLKIIHQQCRILHTRFKMESEDKFYYAPLDARSLLWLQLLLLKGVYRFVCQ